MNRVKKKSYGILLARYSKLTNDMEMIIVEKKYSYGFFDFIYGNYDIYDFNYVKKLFRNMTIGEKKSILVSDFKTIWNHIFNDSRCERNSRYLSKKRKYETFIKRNEIKISDLIKEESSLLLWEFPKGRSDIFESGIFTAIRELQEETSINLSQYEILGNKIEYDIIDNGKIYPVVYYLAICKDGTIDKKKLDNREISDVRWQRVANIPYLNGGKRMKTLIDKSMDSFKNYYV